MTRGLAVRRRVCRPILASCISIDPALGDAGRSERMDMCIEGAPGSDSAVVRGAHCLLREMAGRHSDKRAQADKACQDGGVRRRPRGARHS